MIRSIHTWFLWFKVYPVRRNKTIREEGGNGVPAQSHRAWLPRHGLPRKASRSLSLSKGPSQGRCFDFSRLQSGLESSTTGNLPPHQTPAPGFLAGPRENPGNFEKKGIDIFFQNMIKYFLMKACEMATDKFLWNSLTWHGSCSLSLSLSLSLIILTRSYFFGIDPSKIWWRLAKPNAELTASGSQPLTAIFLPERSAHRAAPIRSITAPYFASTALLPINTPQGDPHGSY